MARRQFPALLVAPGLIGTSLTAVAGERSIQAPDRPWKSAVFSQYPRQEGKVMGRAVRTQHHRYVEWTMSANRLPPCRGTL